MADKVTDLANELSDELDADVLFINHPLYRPLDEKIIRAVCNRKRKTNLLLILVTSGGDPHVSYRIARTIQKKYKNKVSCAISGYCKSAGVLMVIGSTRIYMEDLGELGPIDVQVAKKDTLGEYSSGLTVDEAIEGIQEIEYRLFDSFMSKIIKDSGIALTFKTAAETATALTLGVIQPIASKIEADRVGEDRRSMNIAKEYADRLNSESHILKTYQGSTRITLDMLIKGYPAHGFVIDKEEASVLFSPVDDYPEKLGKLIDALGASAVWPLGDDDLSKGVWRFLSEEKKDASAAVPGGGAPGSNDPDPGGGGPEAPGGSRHGGESGGEIPSDLQEGPEP